MPYAAPHIRDAVLPLELGSQRGRHLAEEPVHVRAGFAKVWWPFAHRSPSLTAHQVTMLAAAPPLIFKPQHALFSRHRIVDLLGKCQAKEFVLVKVAPRRDRHICFTTSAV
jgi:hypothetical protein